MIFHLTREAPTEEPPTVFRRAAQHLLSDFGWSLVPADVLAAQAAQHLGRAADVSLAQAITACQTVYSRLLFAACAGRTQREIGYHELFLYLYKLAYHRVPEADVADVAQEAMRLVYEKLDTCQQPETFLKFAYFRLRHAMNRVRPARLNRLQSLAPWSDIGVDEPPFHMTPLFRRLLLPEEAALQSDEAASVRDCLQKLWRHQPRAAEQLKALILKYFDELDDAAIAEQLGTTVANVHVLRSRGLKKLEACLRRTLELMEPDSP